MESRAEILTSPGSPVQVESPVRALLLEAKLHLLRDDPSVTIRTLAGERFDEERDEMERLLLLGSAFSRSAQYDAADEYFDFAETIAERLHDDEARAEIACRRGRRHVFAGEAEKARGRLEAAACAQSLERRLEALHLESEIYALEGRYGQQAAMLERLLEQIDPADEARTFLAAGATAALAALARELDLPSALPAVERRLRACEWPAELNVQRFQSLKALGWAYALRADYFNAFRYLKKSMAFAPSAAWRSIAAMDRAYLARCLKEERWSRQELSEAEDLAQLVNWRAARCEERVGLLVLAELTACVDAGRAAHYMTQFRELGHAHPLQHGRDERLRAMADYSAGVTQLALGNARAGVKLLRQSLSAYDRVGYDWRAGRCALRLFESTAEPAYLEIAAEKLRSYPNCWLADELRRVTKAKSFLPALPPMQQRVFDELCQGLSTAQIAKNLGRSEYTVKNHIKLIFKAFEVRSRAALIAQVAKRGG